MKALQPQPGPRRLLIVDDEEPILFALNSYFSGVGFEVRVARELEEALTLATAEVFDLVIADVMLTASDEPEGIELLERVRAAGARPLFIILTGFASDEVERRAREHGAEAFLRKPQPLAELESLVRGLLATVERAEPTETGENER